MSSILNHTLEIDGLSIKLPIIQGGMGVKISGPKLAASVANEGGIGIIAVVEIGADDSAFIKDPTKANVKALREAIRKARGLTKGFLGVNIMVALKDYAILVRTALEEKIDFIFAGAGMPLSLPEFLLENSKTKLVPIISSARAARLLTEKWIKKYNYTPDAFVVEGPLAGGHLGFKKEEISDPAFALEKIAPEVISTLTPFSKNGKPIPVIVAGGIFTGADIRKFIDLGAAGVQMGTRFVTTLECDAHINFKLAYLAAKKDDTIIIKSPVGMPGRAIRNNFLDLVEDGKKIPFQCLYHCLKTCTPKESPFCIALALINAQRGNLDRGFAFCGTNAYRTEKIISVHDLIEELKKEYREA